jgi:mannose-6-phosphate isomerase-like protein (cupin superfamily)
VQEPGLSENGRYALGQDLRVTVLTRGVETAGRHDIVRATSLAGKATPLHLHTRYEERVVVLGGSLTVWVGEEQWYASLATHATARVTRQ